MSEFLQGSTVRETPDRRLRGMMRPPINLETTPPVLRDLAKAILEDTEHTEPPQYFGFKRPRKTACCHLRLESPNRPTTEIAKIWGDDGEQTFLLEVPKLAGISFYTFWQFVEKTLAEANGKLGCTCGAAENNPAPSAFLPPPKNDKQ